MFELLENYSGSENRLDISYSSSGSSMRLTKFADQSIEAVEKDVSEITVEGSPAQKVWSHFIGNDEKFKSGMWDCAAGVFKATMSNQIEYCHILEM